MSQGTVRLKIVRLQAMKRSKRCMDYLLCHAYIIHVTCAHNTCATHMQLDWQRCMMLDSILPLPLTLYKRFDVFFLNYVVIAITSCLHACTSAGCTTWCLTLTILRRTLNPNSLRYSTAVLATSCRMVSTLHCTHQVVCVPTRLCVYTYLLLLLGWPQSEQHHHWTHRVLGQVLQYTRNDWKG